MHALIGKRRWIASWSPYSSRARGRIMHFALCATPLPSSVRHELHSQSHSCCLPASALHLLSAIRHARPRTSYNSVSCGQCRPACIIFIYRELEGSCLFTFGTRHYLHPTHRRSITIERGSCTLCGGCRGKHTHSGHNCRLMSKLHCSRSRSSQNGLHNSSLSAAASSHELLSLQDMDDAQCYGDECEHSRISSAIL